MSKGRVNPLAISTATAIPPAGIPITMALLPRYSSSMPASTLPAEARSRNIRTRLTKFWKVKDLWVFHLYFSLARPPEGLIENHTLENYKKQNDKSTEGLLFSLR